MNGESLPPLRHEIKLVATIIDLPRVRAWLSLHPEGFSPSFPDRYVNSLYFDSPAAAMLGKHLAGQGRRTKLRLRWYGALDRASLAHWELKSKEFALGYKRSSAADITLDLHAGTWDRLLAALHDRSEPLVSLYLAACPSPVLLVRYRRQYLESADGILRVTLDTDLSMYHQMLSRAPNITQPNAPSERMVVEFKAPQSQQSRLERALQGCPISLSRHSKYVTGTLEAWSHLG